MQVDRVLHMNGGQDKASYAENSPLQKTVIQKTKHIVEESLRDLCHSSGVPDCITVADLGCSSGPNAFLTIQGILDGIAKACWKMDRETPAVQVFLNDLPMNDFNTLFKSLPGFYNDLEKSEDGFRKPTSCFIAAVPGSFYGRLFPDHSVQFVHSSYSLHWLSQVPKGLVRKSGDETTLNKNNIYIAETSPLNVHSAYLEQFTEDFTTFLRLRSQEMTSTGHLVLTLICKNDKNDGYYTQELLGMIIHDMVKEGLIEEEKLASFDLPVYAPSKEELKQIIHGEGSFKLKYLETFKLPWDANYMASGGYRRDQKAREEYIGMYMRAIFESILASHFGVTIMNELFRRYGKKASEYLEMGKGTINTVVISLVKGSK